MESAVRSTRNKFERIVLLVDMDCFYCQVEEKLNPTLKGRPVAVVQYNAWRGGGIIAVNYAARAKGVTRHMRGDEAKAQCPEIELVPVPSVREKADLSKYRDAGKEVANVLQKFTNLLERASVDEAYLDITNLVNERLDKMNAGIFVLQPELLLNTYAVGYENIGQYVNEITTRLGNRQNLSHMQHYSFTAEDKAAVEKLDIRLLIGASVANEIRAAVKSETEYDCSAGISYNKIVAKLACGINKPNKQTILPLSQIPKFFETLPLSKIKGLGGKFGEEVCERFGVHFLGQLCQYTEEQLQRKFDEKSGTWLHCICRGIDCEPVTSRFYSKSIGCCKRFPGRNCITGLETLQHWLNELTEEISNRLDKDMIENNRRAKQMVVSYTQEFDGEDVPSSRSINIKNYTQTYLARTSLELIKTNTRQFLLPESDKKLNNSIKFLGISVGKFETVSRVQSSLQDLFAQQTAKKRKSNEAENLATTELEEIVDLIEKQDENSKETETIVNNKNKIEILENIEIPATDTKIQTSFFVNYFKNRIKNKPAEQEESVENKNKEEIKFIEVSKETEGIQEVTPNLNTDSNKTAEKILNKTNKKNSIAGFFLKTLSAQIEKPKILSHKIENSKRQSTDMEEILSETTIDDNLSNKRCKIIDVEMQNTEENNSTNTKENTFDYQSSYAEFSMPALNEPCFNFITCEECNKKIASDERSVQMHRDEHFAFKLSQQLRQEFKQTVALHNKSLPEVGTKNQQNKSKATSSNTNIVKFFTPVVAVTDNSGMELCEKCKKLIAKSSLAEHLDYHLAKEMHKEINKLEVSSILTNKKNNERSENINNTKNKVKKPKECASISKFFTKPNC